MPKMDNNKSLSKGENGRTSRAQLLRARYKYVIDVKSRRLL